MEAIINKSTRTYFTVLLLLCVVITIIAWGCKKLVTVAPPETKLTEPSVYSSDESAVSVLTGIYTQLSKVNYNSSPQIPNITMWLGLSSDEFTLWGGGSPDQAAYYKNALSASTGYGTEFWNNTYPFIFICNSAIEGLTSSTSLTPKVKQQLLGEAKFMRAFFYFYLTSLYGDVPLATTSDYVTNATLSRSSQRDVFVQTVNDLKEAKDLLSNDYVMGDASTAYAAFSAERVRPNKAVATALLARIYLYMKDWSNAEIQASEVIGNSAYYALTSLSDVFLKNSQEAIWQLQPVTSGTITNSADAVAFIIPSTGPSNIYPVYLSDTLIHSFERGDERRKSWIDSIIVSGVTYYYPTKYKVNTAGAAVAEYPTIFRLAEQYLIRSEARTQQGKYNDACMDLNAIRFRANLKSIATSNKDSLLTAILHERQVELFAELGHRWLDLNRTGEIDAVMPVVAAKKKGTTWNTYQKLFPLPTTDISKDPNLTQNPGY
jgi:hypothetical protein